MSSPLGTTTVSAGAPGAAASPPVAVAAGAAADGAGAGLGHRVPDGGRTGLAGGAAARPARGRPCGGTGRRDGEPDVAALALLDAGRRPGPAAALRRERRPRHGLSDHRRTGPDGRPGARHRPGHAHRPGRRPAGRGRPSCRRARMRCCTCASRARRTASRSGAGGTGRRAVPPAARRLQERLAEACGRSVEEIAADMRAGRLLTAQEARDYGLVDAPEPPGRAATGSSR